MTIATLSKVGNSMAVLLPKALREQAAITQESTLQICSPRKGVVVITSIEDLNDSKSSRIQEANKRIKTRGKKLPAWPKDKSADDLIREAKKERAHAFFASV